MIIGKVKIAFFNYEGYYFCIKKDLQVTRVIKLKGTKRVDVKPGMRVLIELKKDQRSGKLVDGIVKDVLTNSPNHHYGIKVRLKSGEIGRVKKTFPSKEGGLEDEL